MPPARAAAAARSVDDSTTTALRQKMSVLPAGATQRASTRLIDYVLLVQPVFLSAVTGHAKPRKQQFNKDCAVDRRMVFVSVFLKCSLILINNYTEGYA
jgi:hypothetical protein